MYYHGSFATQTGETVTVHILTGGTKTQETEINNPGSDILFTTDPVHIESSVNDTFDHLLRSSASIRLLTKNFVSDFFCTSCMDAVVNIYRDGKCVFAGFIEPQAYSQPYNETYDELELSCIDILSALQYSNYRNAGGPGVIYDSIKADAQNRSFLDIIKDILGSVSESADITDTGETDILYDGSKHLGPDMDPYGILSQIEIPELLFLSESEDQVWTNEAVLEEILRYLNLHIIQEGLRFYLFSWETITGGATIPWYGLLTRTQEATVRKTADISPGNVASDDTSISIADVFNQISLTCELKEIQDIIEDPLGDNLTSPYTNKQKYMTEYSSDGEGATAVHAFCDMINGKSTDYEGGTITDWYVQVKNNPNWKFPLFNGTGDLIEQYCSDGRNQQDLPNALGFQSLLANGTKAALLSFGKVEEKTDHTDNSPISRIDMEDCLCISVNGNGIEDGDACRPSELDLQQGCPCAVYEGAISGGVLSPADDDTTNYIVISGKIVLNPIMKFSKDYKTLKENLEGGMMPESFLWHHTVPSRNNEDGRYYTQKYYKAATPLLDPVWDPDTSRGLCPFTDTGEQLYEFKYSAIGDNTDKISKVAVLACMLTIGDKCLVETGTDGQITDFEWRPYKTREQCADDDEYYQQCFTIGFDPKIGDKLIGTKFDIQNNISFRLGLDAEGMAIPIKKGNRLSGQVRFMILGPVNTMWDDVTRRHRTWFRRTKWTSTSVPLLPHVSSIFIDNFSMKLYSDNGLIMNLEDNDLVYMSDTKEKFANPKDDITFRICSALTREERQELGVSETARLSTPLNTATKTGLLSIYDRNTGEQAKPEQLYVDSYYREYHKPRVLMEQKIEERSGDVGLFNLYRHPAMPGKTFFVQGLSRNLMEGYAQITLKEIWYD